VCVCVCVLEILIYTAVGCREKKEWHS
jgi:hypothetical protein